MRESGAPVNADCVGARRVGAGERAAFRGVYAFDAAANLNVRILRNFSLNSSLQRAENFRATRGEEEHQTQRSGKHLSEGERPGQTLKAEPHVAEVHGGEEQQSNAEGHQHGRAALTGRLEPRHKTRY